MKPEVSYWIWRCRGQSSAGWWALCPESPPRSSRRCAPRRTASRAWCHGAIHWSSSAARWNIPEHRHINYILATMLEALKISWVSFELDIWQVYCLDKLWRPSTNVICIWTKSICAQLLKTPNKLKELTNVLFCASDNLVATKYCTGARRVMTVAPIKALIPRR